MSRLSLVALSMIGGAIAGAVLGWLSLALAGGGHGTYYPPLLYMGPALLLMWSEHSETCDILIVASFYAGYAAVLTLPRKLPPAARFGIVMAVHYVGVVAALLAFRSGFPTLSEDAAKWGQVFPWIAAATFLSAILHLLAMLIFMPERRAKALRE